MALRFEKLNEKRKRNLVQNCFSTPKTIKLYVFTFFINFVSHKVPHSAGQDLAGSPQDVAPSPGNEPNAEAVAAAAGAAATGAAASKAAQNAAKKMAGTATNTIRGRPAPRPATFSAQGLTQKFFKEIAALMQNVDEIHITGTGDSQEQFMKFLAGTPQYKNAVADESTSNKMSDEKLNGHFRIAEEFISNLY